MYSFTDISASIEWVLLSRVNDWIRTSLGNGRIINTSVIYKPEDYKYHVFITYETCED